MKIKVQLTESQMKDLKNSGTKGKVIEDIAKQVLLSQGALDVFDCKDLEQQINEGDLLVITPREQQIIVEVKTSHTFNKTNKDKLAFDYKYYKKYSYCKKTYLQSTTGTNLGWIFYSQADWVMSYNVESSKLYVIKDYQKLKKNVLEDIENYIKTLDRGSYTWYLRGWNNKINTFLEGGVNKKDNCKDSLIANLELSQKSIENFGGKCVIFDLEIEKMAEKNTLSLATESI